MAKFAFVVDGEVGLVLNLSSDTTSHPTVDRSIACLRSNPQIIEVPEGQAVGPMWKYDGTTFKK